MRAGDRTLICIGDKQYMCAVVNGDSNSELMLVSEAGECVATFRKFRRKTEPMLGQEPRSIESVKHEKITSGTMKRCEAPGCNKVYAVKKSDLARGWGKTCCKSCAAKLREANKSAAR